MLRPQDPTSDIVVPNSFQVIPVEENKNESEPQLKNLRDFLSTLFHDARGISNGIEGNRQIISSAVEDLLTQIDHNQNDHEAEIDQTKLKGILTDMKAKLSTMGICHDDILHLFNDYLTLEAEFTLESKKFNVGKDVLNNLHQLYLPICESKKINLIFPSVQSDLVLVGDAFRLRQVIMNLLSNAIKFTRKINEDSPEVKLILISEIIERQCKLTLEVWNSGSFLTSEQTAKLFQRFSQSSSSVARTHGGSGLGLWICKKIVDLMSGKINCTSSGKAEHPWVKFTFDVEIPLAKKENKKRLRKSTVTPYKKLDAHILLVEDNKINQELTKSMLAKLGCTCDIAATGAEASDLYSSKIYSMVLMDFNLPDITGLELTKRLLKEDKEFRTPIIGLTGETEKREVALKEGMAGFIAKPLNLGSLYEQIKVFAKASSQPQPSPTSSIYRRRCSSTSSFSNSSSPSESTLEIEKLYSPSTSNLYTSGWTSDTSPRRVSVTPPSLDFSNEPLEQFKNILSKITHLFSKLLKTESHYKFTFFPKSPGDALDNYNYQLHAAYEKLEKSDQPYAASQALACWHAQNHLAKIKQNLSLQKLARSNVETWEKLYIETSAATQKNSTSTNCLVM